MEKSLPKPIDIEALPPIVLKMETIEIEGKRKLYSYREVAGNIELQTQINGEPTVTLIEAPTQSGANREN